MWPAIIYLLAGGALRSKITSNMGNEFFKDFCHAKPLDVIFEELAMNWLCLVWAVSFDRI